MKKYGLIFFLLALTSSVFAQESGSNQSTSLCGGHWEFFMSDIAIRLTFKVDKFKGDIYQLVEGRDKTTSWQQITKQGSLYDVQKENAINYQLFSSGMGYDILIYSIQTQV